MFSSDNGLLCFTFPKPSSILVLRSFCRAHASVEIDMLLVSMSVFCQSQSV